jgi:hypothetical protein
VTTASNGAVDAGGTFDREKADVNPGLNVRFGFTNASIDGTVNPDFSQVESDAGQVTVNQRFALFYAEKRPFFLEGIELFSTPNQLVYTRQIVAPIAGGKVTGKFGRLNIAYLTVKEKEGQGASLFNIARIRADLGRNSTAGATVSDRSAAGDFNRVVAIDSRIVFKKLYYVQGQVGQSWTQAAGATRAAPIWLAEYDRTGRAWGFNYRLTGVGTGFQARSGYVPRNDAVEFHASNRLSWYGARGSFIEQFTTFFGPARIWRYAGFGRDGALEGNESMTVMLNVRGGWSVHTTVTREFVRFDPRDYSSYRVSQGAGLAPFEVPGELSGLPTSDTTVTSPTFRLFNASLQVRRAAVAIFPEASEGRETRSAASLNVRPTGSIRMEGSVTFSQIDRARDGSEFARTLIPRLKLEYQPRRALFFRVIGEYRSERQALLRDPRTGAPLWPGIEPPQPDSLSGLRLDLLVSYEPTPGTVAFFGYGSSLETPRTVGLSDLHRQSDGFFVKLAYLFRR